MSVLCACAAFASRSSATSGRLQPAAARSALASSTTRSSIAVASSEGRLVVAGGLVVGGGGGGGGGGSVVVGAGGGGGWVGTGWLDFGSASTGGRCCTQPCSTAASGRCG